MIPIRRDLHFKLKPDSLGHWHSQGPYVTHFVNAMSIFFPEGERYFIHTVRHYRDRISDPELQAALTAFIGVSLIVLRRIRLEAGYRFSRIHGDFAFNTNRVHAGLGFAF